MRGLKELSGKNKAVLLVGAGIILLIGGGAGTFWYLQDGGKPGEGQRIDTKEEAIEALTTPQQNYDRAGASEALAAAAEQAKGSKERADLYQQQALVEQQRNNLAKAIELYEASLKEQDNGFLYEPLAKLYEKTGNKPKAVEYYQKTRAFYEAKDVDFQGRTYILNMTEQKLKELQ